jgi:predicted DNA-binding transcriptional regulator AlpA
MTMHDFCHELGVAPSTAYKWSAAGPGSGRFPRFRKLPNGSIRIRRDWFDEWLERLDPAAR